MEVSNNDVVISFIDGLQSKDALSIVAKSLAENQLISSSPNLGSQDLKSELKKKFEKETTKSPTFMPANEDINLQGLNIAIQSSSFGIKEIYQNRNTRATRTFYLKWLLLGATAVLAIAAGVMIFWQESNKKMTFATSICTLLSGFFGRTISKMHQEEDAELKKIEKDLMQIAKLENFFSLIKNIQDEDELKKAYQKLISQMAI